MTWGPLSTAWPGWPAVSPSPPVAVERPVALGIAWEVTAGRRNRVFAYDSWLTILSEEAEPL